MFGSFAACPIPIIDPFVLYTKNMLMDCVIHMNADMTNDLIITKDVDSQHDHKSQVSAFNHSFTLQDDNSTPVNITNQSPMNVENQSAEYKVSQERNVKILVHQASQNDLKAVIKFQNNIQDIGKIKQKEEILESSEIIDQFEENEKPNLARRNRSRISNIQIEQLEILKPGEETSKSQKSISQNPNFTEALATVQKHKPKQLTSDMKITLDQNNYETEIASPPHNQNLEALLNEMGSRETLQVSESQFLSPIKKKKFSSNASDLAGAISTISSNVSSFYLDKIDELMPEKKSVAEKILKKQQTLADVNPFFEKTPVKPCKPTVNRTFISKLFSLNKKPYTDKRLTQFEQFKKETIRKLKMSKEDEDYQKRENEERIKQKEKRNQAQALKYLRKLGRKLRKTQQLRFNFEQKNLQLQAQSMTELSQAVNKLREESQNEEKISPRVRLMQQQQQSLQKQKDYLDSLEIRKDFTLLVPSSSAFNPFIDNKLVLTTQSSGAAINSQSESFMPHFKPDSYNPSFEFPQALTNTQNKLNYLKFDEMTRTVSFAPSTSQASQNQQQQLQQQKQQDNKIFPQFMGQQPQQQQQVAYDRYAEIDQLMSPILNRRDINPMLDEVEQEYLDLTKEYRETDVYQDFKNYKSYYIDAYLQEVQQAQEEKQKQKKINENNQVQKPQEELKQEQIKPQTNQIQSQKPQMLQPSQTEQSISHEETKGEELKTNQKQSVRISKDIQKGLQQILEHEEQKVRKVSKNKSKLRVNNLSLNLQRSDDHQQSRLIPYNVKTPSGLIRQQPQTVENSNRKMCSDFDEIAFRLQNLKQQKASFRLTKPSIKKVCKNLKELYQDILQNNLTPRSQNKDLNSLESCKNHNEISQTIRQFDADAIISSAALFDIKNSALHQQNQRKRQPSQFNSQKQLQPYQNTQISSFQQSHMQSVTHQNQQSHTNHTQTNIQPQPLQDSQRGQIFDNNGNNSHRPSINSQRQQQILPVQKQNSLQSRNFRITFGVPQNNQQVHANTLK
eukprot:403364897